MNDNIDKLNFERKISDRDAFVRLDLVDKDITAEDFEARASFDESYLTGSQRWTVEYRVVNAKTRDIVFHRGTQFDRSYNKLRGKA